MAFVQVLPRRVAGWIAAEPDWDEVYAEQLPRVVNFFRYRMGQTADVEDLTARTFEKAFMAVFPLVPDSPAQTHGDPLRCPIVSGLHRC